MLQIQYKVTAAEADASYIYIESLSFSLLCTVVYAHGSPHLITIMELLRTGDSPIDKIRLTRATCGLL
jgi:hypothetical protein